MIGKILLAVDGSENAYRATDIAAELAQKLGAELMIAHVLMHGRPPIELVRMAEVEHLVEEAHAVALPGVPYVSGRHLDVLQGELNEARTSKVIAALGDQIVARAKARCAELGVRDAATTVCRGDYADALLDTAEGFAADMIVIGTRGLGALKRAVLGSVSQKVLHHAACSVVCVR